MSRKVQRFLVRAYPSRGNTKWPRWQVLGIWMFIGEDNHTRAWEEAKKLLARKHLVLLEVIDRSTLKDEAVQRVGGAVLRAYEQAKNGVPQIGQFSSKPDFEMRGPPINEAFVDELVKGAGGRRLTDAEANHGATRNADYRLGEALIELKILAEEPLEKVERQSKLSQLFKDLPVGSTVDLRSADPEALEEILGSRVKKVIHSAADQIRQTRKHLGEPNLTGYVILLNTGHWSLDEDGLLRLAKKTVKKPGSTIAEAICITAPFQTNGFDGVQIATFQSTCDNESADLVIAKLGGRFSDALEELMTQWVLGGTADQGLESASPVAFEADGKYFRWDPGELPDSRFGAYR